MLSILSSLFPHCQPLTVSYLILSTLIPLSLPIHIANLALFFPLQELWTLLSHLTLPLALFYRFHSSVCLADMWKAAYEAEEAH